MSTCCTCVGHNYTGATCTVAGKCSRCGEIGSTLSHAWESDTHYEAAHPHKVYKNCTSCSAYTYTGTTTNVSTCCSCVGHNYTGATCTVAEKCTRCGTVGNKSEHSTYVGYEVAHPHREYYKCRNCDYYSYIGTSRESWESNKRFEASHPHREYVKCTVENGCSGYKYVGANRESWEANAHFEATHPHKEYVICNAISGCSEYKYTGTFKDSYLGCTTCHTVHNFNIKDISKVHTTKGHEVTLKCSCGEIINGGYEKANQCCQCGNHPWDSGLHFENVHADGLGHRYYYKCTKEGCQATKYTGTYRQEWEDKKHHEKVHPHKEYYRCSVVEDCEGYKFTGACYEKWDSQEHFENVHPHKLYRKCLVEDGCTGFVYTGINKDLSTKHFEASHIDGKGHKSYDLCTCGETTYDGVYVPYPDSNCLKCNPAGHSHSWIYEYEVAHPHKKYQLCSDTHDGIRIWKYTGDTQLVRSCIECPIPDLVITNIDFSPSSPKEGNNVTFIATVANKGRGATQNGVIHGVQFFVDGTQIDGVTGHTSSIPSGGEIKISGLWSNATAGTHTIKAIVDNKYDRIYELNENNNDSTTTITVEKSIEIDPGTDNGGGQGTGNSAITNFESVRSWRDSTGVLYTQTILKNGSVAISLKSPSGSEVCFDAKGLLKTVNDILELNDYSNNNFITVKGSKNAIDNAIENNQGSWKDIAKGSYEYYAYIYMESQNRLSEFYQRQQFGSIIEGSIFLLAGIGMLAYESYAIHFARTRALATTEVVVLDSTAIRGTESAKVAQINTGYAADTFELTYIPKGTKVYGGLPGQTAWYTDATSLEASGYSRSTLFKGLQVEPNPELGYRPQVGMYETIDDMYIPGGKALANKQYGAGGYQQYYVQNYGTKLKLIDTIKLGE